jgi:hypothetical protein
MNSFPRRAASRPCPVAVGEEQIAKGCLTSGDDELNGEGSAESCVPVTTQARAEALASL